MATFLLNCIGKVTLSLSVCHCPFCLSTQNRPCFDIVLTKGKEILCGCPYCPTFPRSTLVPLSYPFVLPSTIDENYWVITLIYKKYGNLPLCLENYALFSLAPTFTIIFYTYPLKYIIYVGESSRDIFSNYHGTLIHIYMH